MFGEVGKLIDRRGNLSEELLTASKGPEFGNRPETTRIRDVGTLEHMLVNIWGGQMWVIDMGLLGLSLKSSL